MKRHDIDVKFTKKVAEFISEGYTINSESMKGSQGEIGKVDLVKGDELIRIWLNKECDFSWDDPNKWNEDKIVLRVSRWNYPYTKFCSDMTVWMKDLTHHEEYVFYELGKYHDDKWYVESLAEALQCVKKRNSRVIERNRYNRVKVVEITSEISKEIAANYLKNHKGYQRVSRERIQVLKRVYFDGSKPEYLISYNDSQNYRLV